MATQAANPYAAVDFAKFMDFGKVDFNDFGKFAEQFKLPGVDNKALVEAQRQNVEAFPDLWASGLDLADMRQVSDANPQQAEYNWATAELTTCPTSTLRLQSASTWNVPNHLFTPFISMMAMG